MYFFVTKIIILFRYIPGYNAPYHINYLVFRRAKTHKGRRFLEAREPKLNENTKTTMFIRGGRTSEIVTQALKDLVSNCQPLCNCNILY